MNNDIKRAASDISGILWKYHSVIMLKLQYETRMNHQGLERINNFMINLISNSNNNTCEEEENPIQQSLNMMLWNFLHFNCHIVDSRQILNVNQIIMSSEFSNRRGRGRPTTLIFLDSKNPKRFMEPFIDPDGILHIGAKIQCAAIQLFINSNGGFNTKPEIKIGFFDFMQGDGKYGDDIDFFFPSWHFNTILSEEFENKTKIVKSRQCVDGDRTFFINASGAIDWKNYWHDQREI